MVEGLPHPGRRLEPVVEFGDVIRIDVRHAGPDSVVVVGAVVVVRFGWLGGHNRRRHGEALCHRPDTVGEGLEVEHLVHAVSELNLGDEVVAKILVIVVPVGHASAGVLDEIPEGQHGPLVWQLLPPVIGAEQPCPGIAHEHE